MITLQIINLFAWSSILLAGRLANADDSSVSIETNNESSIETSPTDVRPLYLRQSMTAEALDKAYDQAKLTNILRRMFISNRNLIGRQRRVESPNHSFIRFGRAAIPASKELHKDVWQNAIDMRRMTKNANRDTSFIRFGRSLNEQQNG